MWRALKLTNLKYDERLKIIMGEFHLSDKTIEQVTLKKNR
jgi:hypothetical protein